MIIRIDNRVILYLFVIWSRNLVRLTIVVTYDHKKANSVEICFVNRVMTTVSIESLASDLSNMARWASF